MEKPKKSLWESYKGLKWWIFAGGIALAGAGLALGAGIAAGEAAGIGAINAWESRKNK